MASGSKDLKVEARQVISERPNMYETGNKNKTVSKIILQKFMDKYFSSA
jgi:hypothetical protein